MTLQYEQENINLSTLSEIPPSISALGRVGLNGPPGDVELGISNTGTTARELSIMWSISVNAAGPLTETVSIIPVINGVALPGTVIPIGTAPGASGLVNVPAGTQLPPGQFLLVVTDPDFGGGPQVAGNMFLTVGLSDV